jgi:hypothetical protein
VYYARIATLFLTMDVTPADTRLAKQFDPEVPYQPFKAGTLDMLTVDQEVQTKELYRKKLVEQTRIYGKVLVEKHVYHVKKEWFYQFFYEYNRCNMDATLDKMYSYICRAYPLYVAKNELIKQVFTKVKATKELLTRKLLMLIFIGEEKDISDHIFQMVERSVRSEDNPPTEMGLDFRRVANSILKKTRRLLDYLPIMVSHYIKTSFTQYNIAGIATRIVYESMRLYETGVPADF